MSADDWRNAAACKGLDAGLFYPERGASTREAKAVCADCVVSFECNEFAEMNVERFGIWGGRSERQRRMSAHQRGIVRGSESTAA